MDIEKIKSSSALQVFGATTLGYGFAFFYEAGYLGYFDIDYNFVQITPIQIITGVIVSMLLFFLWDVIYAYTWRFHSPDDKHSPVSRFNRAIFIILCMFTGTFVILAVLTRARDILHIFLLILSLLLLVLGVYIFPFLSHLLRLRSWRGAIEAGYAKYDEAYASKKRGIRSRPLMVQGIIFPVLTLFLLLFLCNLVGLASASIDDKFVTVISSSGATKEIVVRDYGDNLILKAFDTRSKALLPGFSIEQSNGKNFSATVLRCSASFIKEQQKGNTNPQIICP